MNPSETEKNPVAEITFESVQQAAVHVQRYAHRTPVVTCRTLDEMSGHQLFFKCENLQKTGAFKFRGAINALSQLDAAERGRGVVTHSSGNHAQALAAAARIFGIDAHIVMPSTAPAVKKNAVLGYGGRVVECEPTLQARLDVSAAVQSETGATMIPPFNHHHVIAGQGTCAMELLDELPDLDYIIAPVGGGGLISGTCISTQAMSKKARVIAAEPQGADDAFRSKKSGQLFPQTSPNTIADGLLTSLGDLTWPFVRDVVHEVITVDDEQIVKAMHRFIERTKLVIEPSAAVSVAVALQASFATTHGNKIGVILSGGNVDLTRLPF